MMEGRGGAKAEKLGWGCGAMHFALGSNSKAMKRTCFFFSSWELGLTFLRSVIQMQSIFTKVMGSVCRRIGPKSNYDFNYY